MTKLPTNARSIVDAFLSGLRPPPGQTIDQWAEECRYLPTETAADAGRWSNAKTPYLVEIMRALSPSYPAIEVVFQGSSRIGKSECLNNAVGFYMDAVRCPIMVGQPIEADAEEWSKDHLDPLIAYTPRLAQLVTPDAARRKGNTILHKRYKGGIVYVVGASTPKSFRRRTVRVLLLDEVDAYPGSLDGEGDPIALAKERTSTFPFSKKVFLCSTPTIKGASRIETAFLETDQRYYLVPCPYCEATQRLVWSQIHWPEGRPQDAEYVCSSCGTFIPHHKKPKMLAEGRWHATFPERAKVGFQISALYSPWVSWADLAVEWEEVHKDPVRLQVFVNTKLGETFDLADADQWDPDGLMSLREDIETLPARVSLLTSAVDVQGDRLVLQVDAWGPGEERWTLERRDLHGDPSFDPANPKSVWTELDQLLLSIRYRHELGGTIAIRATCVDTGGLSSAQAYAFCRSRQRRRVWAIKGDSGMEGARIWPRVPSRKNKGKLPLYLLGVFAGKENCHGRLRASVMAMRRGERSGPSYWHFARHPAIAESYFEELTAEVCVVEYAAARGQGPRPSSARRRRWRLRRPDIRNEALDCSVYSYAALHGLIALGARLDGRPRLTPDAPSPTPSAGKTDIPVGRAEVSNRTETRPTVQPSPAPVMNRPAPRSSFKARKRAVDYM